MQYKHNKVTFLCNEEIPEEEANAYIERGLEKMGPTLATVDAVIDGDDVELTYTCQDVPFERIRRITGYLVGTLDRFNDGKRAEEADRVKHSV